MLLVLPFLSRYLDETQELTGIDGWAGDNQTSQSSLWIIITSNLCLWNSAQFITMRLCVCLFMYEKAQPCKSRGLYPYESHECKRWSSLSKGFCIWAYVQLLLIILQAPIVSDLSLFFVKVSCVLVYNFVYSVADCLSFSLTNPHTHTSF